MRIDADNGDRTIVLSACPDPIGGDESLSGLSFHPSEDALRIYGDRRFRYRLDSGARWQSWDQRNCTTSASSGSRRTCCGALKSDGSKRLSSIRPKGAANLVRVLSA